MRDFLREHSWAVVVSVLLHGLLVGGLLLAALNSVRRPLPSLQPLPIEAVVVDSQVLHAAQRARAERAEQEAARARAAAEAQAAAAAKSAEEARAAEAARARAASCSARSARARCAACKTCESTTTASIGRGCKLGSGLRTEFNAASNRPPTSSPCSSTETTTAHECSRRKSRIQPAPPPAPLTPLRGAGRTGSVRNPTFAAPACCSSTMARTTVP